MLLREPPEKLDTPFLDLQCNSMPAMIEIFNWGSQSVGECFSNTNRCFKTKTFHCLRGFCRDPRFPVCVAQLFHVFTIHDLYVVFLLKCIYCFKHVIYHMFFIIQNQQMAPGSARFDWSYLELRSCLIRPFQHKQIVFAWRVVWVFSVVSSTISRIKLQNHSR